MASIVDLPESRLRKADRIALKARLGLGLAPDEAAFVGRLRLRTTFRREEVVELLGFADPKSPAVLPRMLPVDIALGRLGMPIVRAHPDGTAERLVKEFRKAWAARWRSDRAIATYVAKTCTEVPKGWYPDAERLQMSDAEAEGAGLPALGSAERAALAELAPYFRFDLLPDRLRLMGYQMWQRRRLAGIAPSACEGLVYGFWDDAMSAYDVAAMSWRGFDAMLLAVRLAAARDLCLAAVASRCSGAGYWAFTSTLRGGIAMALVQSVDMEDPSEPDPDSRILGRGFAELYRRLEAGPGAVWSERPVRERRQGSLGEKAGFRVSGSPDRFDPQGPYLEPELDWVSRFASA